MVIFALSENERGIVGMRGKADGAANTWDSYPCANVWEDNGLGYCRDFNCTSMILVTTRCERGGSAVDEEHREDYRIRIRPVPEDV